MGPRGVLQGPTNVLMILVNCERKLGPGAPKRPPTAPTLFYSTLFGGTFSHGGRGSRTIDAIAIASHTLDAGNANRATAEVARGPSEGLDSHSLREFVYEIQDSRRFID